MKIYGIMLATIAALSLSLGCATLVSWGSDVCDLMLDGSKAGKICAQIEKLNKDEAEEEGAIAE